jgi:hypothetical protein
MNFMLLENDCFRITTVLASVYNSLEIGLPLLYDNRPAELGSQSVVTFARSLCHSIVAPVI